jgi:uncharacterized protein YjiS (DUF1127 family)
MLSEQVKSPSDHKTSGRRGARAGAVSLRLIDGGSVARPFPALPKRDAAPVESAVAVSSVPTSYSVASEWAWMFDSAMAGFALYGALLHPNAVFPNESYATATLDRPRPVSEPAPSRPMSFLRGIADYWSAMVRGGRESEARVRPDTPDRRWLIESCDPVSDLFVHWRTERGIKKAVAALSELDDHELRDIGIPSRDMIEHAVRYCHDC